MKRSSILYLTGSAALAVALPAQSQTKRLPRLGFLGKMPETEARSAADLGGGFARP